MDFRHGDRDDVDGNRIGPCSNFSGCASLACWLHRGTTGDHMALDFTAVWK